MQTMKTARKAYRQEFSRVIEDAVSSRREWRDDAPGLRAFIRANRRLWPSPVGKLAKILEGST